MRSSPRIKPPIKTKKSLKIQKNEHNGIAGLTAFVSYPFVQSLIILAMVQLVEQHILTPQWAIGTGLVLGGVFTPLVFILFRQQVAKLLNQQTIVRPGCLAGLIVYPILVIVAFVILWQSKSIDSFSWIWISIPIWCFGLAWLVTLHQMRRYRH